jgi:phosphopantetheinyl transferase (holo-ACP synthase)
MFAKQFCCKEAVFKALRISPDAIRLDEIETVTDFSSFKASLYGKTKQAAETAGAGGVYFSCSASGGGGYVMAYAVCLKNVE